MCFRILSRHRFSVFFFFNDTATTEIYTLSLHDALPISVFGLDGEAAEEELGLGQLRLTFGQAEQDGARPLDRKSTRLNSSHSQISYAVFCLKKKKKLYRSRMLLDAVKCRLTCCNVNCDT